MVDAASDPEVPTSPMLGHGRRWPSSVAPWATCPPSRLFARSTFEGTVQRVYTCLYETHDLARLEVVLDWIDDDL